MWAVFFLKIFQDSANVLSLPFPLQFLNTFLFLIPLCIQLIVKVISFVNYNYNFFFFILPFSSSSLLSGLLFYRASLSYSFYFFSILFNSLCDSKSSNNSFRFYFAVIRSLGIISLPSNESIWSTIATTNSR